jgi:hypothetical protein
MIKHALPALAVAFALTACGEPSSVQTLQDRVATTVSPANTCNSQASVEYLPNGARIRFPDSLFLPARGDLTECGHYALASVTQAMLDPSIMQVIVETDDSGGPGTTLSLRRAEAVRTLLTDVGFVPYQPPVVVQAAPVPSQGVLGVVLQVAANN